MVSTINGDSNVPFYKELGNQGLKATDVPVVAFSVGEEELRGVDTKPLVGHLAAWNYFMSLKNPENDAFIKKYRDWPTPRRRSCRRRQGVTNDPMEATYIGIHMWKQAVEKAKSTDADKVIAAMAGQTFKAPSGITSKMDEKNHHLWKSVFIGEVQANGQFNVVWKTKGPVRAAALEPVHRRQRQEEGASRTAKPSSRQVTPSTAITEGPLRRPLHRRCCIRFLRAFAWAVRSRSAGAAALDAATVAKLGFGDGDEKIAAIAALVARAIRRRGAAAGGQRGTSCGSGNARAVIVRARKPPTPSPGAGRAAAGGPRRRGLQQPLRRELGGALAALKLVQPDRAVRLAAAKELPGKPTRRCCRRSSRRRSRRSRPRRQGHRSS